MWTRPARLSLHAVTIAIAILVLLAGREARAFCGFYVGGTDAKLFNNATQVVLMREGQRTVLSMQNNYQGPPAGFAMVVPVPVILQKENVKTLPREVFDKIDQLDSPRLVEYWEQNPCPVPREERMMEPSMAMAPPPSAPMGAAAKSDLGVRVEAKFSVGEYDILILSAEDAGGLETWLRREKYNIPDGAAPYLRPYVESGSKFFVAKVDPKKVRFENGMATLSPLRFHYDTTELRLPVRLGLINAKDTQDIIVHILARGQRYDVANYPNVTIPTNIDVSEDTKKTFSSFYAALFDATIEKNPGAVVTEYAWDATTCDPCPGPALDAADFATLGDDVLQRGDYHAMSNGGFTLTRVHARYTKASLGADLVFRAAPPIVGGREFMQEGSRLERGARPDSTNNFQGRYAIRHLWTGPIECDDPKRGVWGGPPNDLPIASPDTSPKAARDLAFAPRGTVRLTSLVRSEVPELGIAGPTAASLAANAPRSGGCAGCSTASGRGEGALLLLVAIALGVRRYRVRRPN